MDIEQPFRDVFWTSQDFNMMWKADLDKIVPGKFGIDRLPDKLQQ